VNHWDEGNLGVVSSVRITAPTWFKNRQVGIIVHNSFSKKEALIFLFFPSKSTEVLTLMYCILGFPNSNLRRHTDYLETLVDYVNLSGHSEIYPKISTRPLPSHPFKFILRVALCILSYWQHC
jgi:hypothetical protein